MVYFICMFIFMADGIPAGRVPSAALANVMVMSVPAVPVAL